MPPKNSNSYRDSGVDIDLADAAKEEMKMVLQARNKRVLNSVGAFASLIDIQFPQLKEPVLVLKMEEPGSKQLLAAQEGHLETIGYDLVHHLINDVVVMGAKPFAMLDLIICGQLQKEQVVNIVEVMAQACHDQGCELVGGETSEQPRVIPSGTYILGATCAGIVDRSRIIDGSKIMRGNAVVAVSSNGAHTNGYTLIRSMMEKDRKLRDLQVGEGTFIEAVLRPHLCYNNPLQEAFNQRIPINGLAHITGGGIVDNTKRIIPDGLCAEIDLAAVEILPLFKIIRESGQIDFADMLRTYNLGVGLVAILAEREVDKLQRVFEHFKLKAYKIGTIIPGEERISCVGALRWT